MKGSIPLMLSQNKAVVMYYCVGCLMQNNVKEETCDFWDLCDLCASFFFAIRGCKDGSLRTDVSPVRVSEAASMLSRQLEISLRQWPFGFL
jgi:hypothetical protein